MEKAPQEEKCPRCPDEVLINVMANLLVCRACDITFVKREHVNNPTGPMELLPE